MTRQATRAGQRRGEAVGIDRAKLALAVRRHRNDRTLRDVAPEVGISFAGLARIERGEGTNADTYARICSWLGVPADHFVRRMRA